MPKTKTHAETENYTHRVVRGASIIFIMSIFASLSGYFLRFFLARALSPKEFGLVYAIFSLFGVLLIAKELGLRPALSKHIVSFLVHKEYGKIKGAFLFVFLMQILLATLIGIIIIFLASFLSRSYFHTDAARLPLIIYAVAFMIHPVHAMFKPAFQGFQFMTLFSLIDFVKITGVLVFSLILIPFFGVSAPMIGYFLVYLLAPLTLYIPLLLKKLRRIPGFMQSKLEFTRPLCKQVFLFGAPLILGEVTGIVMSYSDTLVLTYFSLVQVGLYNIALPLSKVLWRITTTLTTVFFPLSSELWARKDVARLQSSLLRLHKYSLILVFPAAVLLFFFGDFAITVLFGSTYLPALTALRFLSLGAIFYTIAQLNMTTLLGIGHPYLVTKLTTGLAVLDVLGNILLIPSMGIMGAVLSTVANFVILMFLSFFYIKKYVGLRIPWLLFARITVLNLIYTGSVFVLLHFLKPLLNGWLVAIMVVLLSSVIYLGGLFLLHIVTKEELSQLWKRIRKK